MPSRAGYSPSRPLQAIPSPAHGSGGRVRPLVDDDIPKIVELHRRIYPAAGQTYWPTEAAYRAHFEEIFLRYPRYDEAMPSLVYHEDDGRVIGCLGVMPRRMFWDGRPIQVAMTHHFMVDPFSRSTLAGVKLLKPFLAGPQDVSAATEANHMSRKVWEGLGSKTSLLYSIRWTRALRPSRFVLSRLKTRPSLAPFALALGPFGRVVDAALARAPKSHFQQSAPRVSGEELEAETMLGCLHEFSRGRSLWCVYDDASLKWLLEILARRKADGAFQKVLVRNPKREIIGWYLYYANPGGLSEVVQIIAKSSTIEDVLDHLFYRAWREGAIAVSGQLDPLFMHAFLAKQCFFHGGSWMLAHSRNPELLHALDRGDAFLTRLEGEWPLGL